MFKCNFNLKCAKDINLEHIVHYVCYLWHIFKYYKKSGQTFMQVLHKMYLLILT